MTSNKQSKFNCIPFLKTPAKIAVKQNVIHSSAENQTKI